MKLKKALEDIYPDTLLFLVAIAYVIATWEKDWTHVAGISVALVSASVWITSRIQLGKSFAMAAQAKELVTKGLYSKIRNPMYVFSTLMVVEIIIALNYWYLYILVALLVGLQIYRARKEERILEAKFGQKYLDYKRTTWL